MPLAFVGCLYMSSGVIPVADPAQSCENATGWVTYFGFLNTFCETPPKTAFRFSRSIVNLIQASIIDKPITINQ